ncbi:hypothetical protein JDS91_27275 [Bacillus cereus]|uniref:hypothetical protein n=1 Tax=Bacillus cereus group TaxID=86661 RepID=UPI0018F79D7B|nr:MULTISPECIES: hypothetical protein [Bacillus cereus group]MBJ8154179.1 hypothetical protein [Bacillus cereus]MBJ8204975.1 hypothetical protein [Bacillus cereus]
MLVTLSCSIATQRPYFIAGMQGKWKVVGSNGRDLEKGKLSDPRTPRFVKKVPTFLSKKYPFSCLSTKGEAQKLSL